MGPTQTPIRCVPEAYYRGVEGPGSEADHLPSFIAEVKNVWSCTLTPPYTFMPCVGVVLLFWQFTLTVT